MYNELRHHGIKGQKWGVRNGPPYPLKESKKSQKEKKLQKTLSKTTGGAVSDIALPSLASSAAVLASVVAVRVMAHLNMVNERNEHLKFNKSPIKQIKTPHTEEQDQEAINKVGFDSGKPGYRMNCAMCTTAYELRRRGYDVKAETSICGRTEKEIASWWKNTTKNDFQKTKSFNEFKMNLDKQPDGSRGNVVTGAGPFDAKHSMVWEKKDGKVVIRDCQSNMSYTDIDTSIIRQKSRHGYQILRTDNREINWDTVRDAVMPK